MPEWRLTRSFVIGFVGSTEMIKIRVPWGAPELSLWSGKITQPVSPLTSMARGGNTTKPYQPGILSSVGNFG